MNAQSLETSLASLPAEGKKIKLRLGLGRLGEILDGSGVPGVEALAPLIAELILKPFASCIRVRGSICTNLSYQCVRCLERFDFALDSRFEFSLQLDSGPDEAEETELNSDDLDMVPFDGSSLDPLAIVEEQFYLALQSNPVCAENCRGLCSSCGGNLNNRQCGCAAGAADSPFAKLVEWGQSRFPKNG